MVDSDEDTAWTAEATHAHESLTRIRTFDLLRI